MSSRRVAIVSAAISPKPALNRVRQTWKEMIVDTVYDALDQVNMNPREIQSAFYGYHGEGSNGYGGIGPTISDTLAISPAPTFVTTSNCVGSIVSIKLAYEMIASGECNIALAGGFDKMQDNIVSSDYICASTEAYYDYMLGINHHDGFVLGSVEYFNQFGYDNPKKAKVLIKFAQEMRKYASNCPKSIFHGAPVPTEEELLLLPDWLWYGTLGPYGESSGAVILVSEDLAYKYTDKPVFIKSCVYTGDSHYFGNRYDYSTIKYPGLPKNTHLGYSANAFSCADMAYKKAGIAPKDIDVLMIFDYIASGLILLEAMGICKPGQAGDFVIDGGISIDGEFPTNTDGGNICRGAGSGPDGMLYVHELFRQLRGEADNQVKGAKIGVADNIGGYLAHSTCIVLANG